MHIKATVKCNFILRMAKIKKIVTNADKDMEKLEPHTLLTGM